MTKKNETPAAAEVITCKQFADSLYSRKGDAYLCVGGKEVKFSKLALWNDLAKTPDEPSPFVLTNPEAEAGVRYLVEVK